MVTEGLRFFSIRGGFPPLVWIPMRGGRGDRYSCTLRVDLDSCIGGRGVSSKSRLRVRLLAILHRSLARKPSRPLFPRSPRRAGVRPQGGPPSSRATLRHTPQTKPRRDPRSGSGPGGRALPPDLGLSARGWGHAKGGSPCFAKTMRGWPLVPCSRASERAGCHRSPKRKSG